MLDSTSRGHYHVKKCIINKGARSHYKHMTEEEFKALQEAKEAAEQKLQELETSTEATRAEAEKAKQDLQKVVDELKEERRKKQEALDKANINNETPDVDSLVEQALQKKERERRERELEEAINEFKSSKSEFQSDTSGVVFDKFKEGLKRFNFSDVKSKDEAKKRLDEAYRFLNAGKKEEDENDYEGSPKDAHNVPDKSGELTSDAKTVMESARINEEKYTELKNKYSDAFEGLGIR